MRTEREVRLSTKIAGATLLTAVLISVIISSISIYQMNRRLLESSRKHAASVAQTAAEFVDGELFASLQEGDEDTEVYSDILATLTNFLADEDIEYIYTMRKQNGEVQFVVDADEEGGSIGEAYESYDKIEEAFRGKVTLDDEATTDEWGSFYSAFAPIYAGNEVVGIVGVDCSVSDIRAQTGAVLKGLLTAEAACIVLCVVLSLIIGKFMSKNVRVINEKMNELASREGDLTRELTIGSRDEIGQVARSFNMFMNKLRSMMLAVKDNETRLNAVTDGMKEQIASSVEELAGIVTALNDMTHAMGETEGAVREISETAGGARSLSQDVFDKAKESAESALATGRRADAIKEESIETKQRVQKMTGEIADNLSRKIEEAKRVEQIVNLTEQIISISKQTQLLALNASIEAARAGDSGRGFAVVAEEIGKLADATAQTAREIVDINQFTVNAVNDLAGSAGSLVSFVQQEVQKDYDTMVEVSSAYSRDAIQFMTGMEQFSELSLGLNQKLTCIEENIGRMMTAVGEEAENISFVTANAEKISGKMQSLREESHVNEQIVNELEEVLSRFTV